MTYFQLMKDKRMNRKWKNTERLNKMRGDKNLLNGGLKA